MSDEEVADFLDGRHTMTLVTVGPDGWPHAVAMWYARVGDSVFFMTYKGSQKQRNLERDSRVTLLVESGEQYSELRGVQIRARGSIVHDEHRRVELAMLIAKRYGPVDLDIFAKQLPKRVVYAAQPVSTASWDHSKL